MVFPAVNRLLWQCVLVLARGQGLRDVEGGEDCGEDGHLAHAGRCRVPAAAVPGHPRSGGVYGEGDASFC